MHEGLIFACCGRREIEFLELGGVMHGFGLPALLEFYTMPTITFGMSKRASIFKGSSLIFVVALSKWRSYNQSSGAPSLHSQNSQNVVGVSSLFPASFKRSYFIIPLSFLNHLNSSHNLIYIEKLSK